MNKFSKKIMHEKFEINVCKKKENKTTKRKSGIISNQS